jgi:hypothetical protein
MSLEKIFSESIRLVDSRTKAGVQCRASLIGSRWPSDSPQPTKSDTCSLIR